MLFVFFFFGSLMLVYGCYRLTDYSLRKIINGCPNLVSLDISECFQITSGSFKGDEGNHSALNQLEEICVSGCKKFDDDCLSFLSMQCAELSAIKMEGCEEVSDEAFSSFLLCTPKLEYIDIGECKAIGNITINVDLYYMIIIFIHLIIFFIIL